MSEKPQIIPNIFEPTNKLKWGAYTGGTLLSFYEFEKLVGKKVDIYAVFIGWDTPFPTNIPKEIQSQSKKLVIFWEPSFGYDSILDGSKDAYIIQFANDAKAYDYPIILSPFDEMNLNEEAWGYSQNNNSAEKFKKVWIHIYNIFTSSGAKNVKFAITYNNDSIPDTSGNWMYDYYPGKEYVDYIGLDGFNFNTPPLTFAEIFDATVNEASTFNKPIFLISTASDAGPQKANWIKEGFGTTIKNYKSVVGWVWFNQGGKPNWKVDSDQKSLNAFKDIIP